MTDLIIGAATARMPGTMRATALRCKRRPNHRPCRGHLEVRLQQVPSVIQWFCPLCGDKAAFAIGRCCLTEKHGVGTLFRKGADFFARYGPMLKGRRREVFITALLDTKNRLIRDEKVSEGTLTETIVHPREVFNRAIRESANTVALIHNHPSGDPRPSRDDRNLTERLVEVGNLVGIHVLDHIIVGNGRFFSFAEEGLI